MNPTAAAKIKSIQNSCLKKFLEVLDLKLPEDLKIPLLKTLAFIPHITASQLLYSTFKNFPENEDLIKVLGDVRTNECAEILIEQARQMKAINRDLIVESLSGFPQDFVFDFLITLLDDPDRHVRFQAAHGLFLQGGKRAALCLCKYISDPDEWISMSILKLLSYMKEHETIPFLQEQYFKEQEIRRKAVMVSFLSLFRSITLINIFDDGLKSKDARLRANSIEAIAQLELPQREREGRIMRFVRDPNNRIRANAVLALAKGQPLIAHDQITDMIHSSDVQLRRSAAYILGNINPEGFEGSAAALLEDVSDDVRRRMIFSLNSFPKDFVVEQLPKITTDVHPWVRKFAIDLATRVPGFHPRNILKQLKKETTAPNIISCLKFLGANPFEDSMFQIKGILKDKREAVVCEAIQAVGKMSGSDGLETIYPLIDHRNPEILKTYNKEKFSRGGLEVLDFLMERATNTRNSQQMRLLMPSLTACLGILNLGEAIPEPLLEKLSKEARPEPIIAPPPPVVQPTLDLEQPLDLLDIQIPESQPLVEKPPQDPSQLLSDGLKEFNKNQYGKAREMFLKVIEINTQFVKANLYLGLISYEERDYTSARQHLVKYLVKNPLDTKAAFPLIKILQTKKEWEFLERLLERFIPNLDKLSEKAKNKIKLNYGTTLFFQGKYPQAVDVLLKLHQTGLKSGELSFYLAKCYCRKKENTLAKPLLQEALELLPPGKKLHKQASNALEDILGKKSEESNPGN